MLDLNKLEPEPVQVTMAGSTFVVHPAKVRGLIEISKFLDDIKKTDPEEALNKAFEILERYIPDFKDKKIDFSQSQMLQLIWFIRNGCVMPKEESPKKGSKKKGS